MNLMIAVVLIVVTALITGYALKKYIKNKSEVLAQPFLENGPSHSQKQGTPTTGGIVFLGTYFIVVIIIALFFLFFKNLEIIIFLKICFVLLIIAGYFWIGYQDDQQKILNKKNEAGLTPKQKLIIQFLLGIILAVIIGFFRGESSLQFYLFDLEINISIVYYLLIPIVVSGLSNATNLTDGLDGLLATNMIISLLFLSIIAWDQNQIVIILSNIILIGSLLGFLYYNRYPAKIFMGDVGSLTLGAYMAIIAIILHLEVLLILLAFVYLWEMGSVIVQVSYFKWTKKQEGTGKRLLLMAPFHHHLEKKGYNENKIVIIAVIGNIVCGLIALVCYF